MVGEQHGFLLVDKPKGVTSRRVVDVAQQRWPGEKIGHCGTLDPMATGLLVLAVGKARRLIDFVQQLPKTYVATFRLGVTSATDDTESELVPAGDPFEIDEPRLRAAMQALTGQIMQTPPQYSAVRVRGRRAHELARSGVRVRLEPRLVRVYRFELQVFRPPELVATIECGKGTYIRALARDLGQKLGCGAVMTALKRTTTGPFRLDDAIPLGALEEPNAPIPPLKPLRDAVQHLPGVVPAAPELARLAHGQPLRMALDLPPGAERVAVLDSEGRLVAVAEYDVARRLLRPRIVLAP